jgi:hypothetical protein
MSDGRYRIEIWDTWKGCVLSHAETRAAGGKLRIRLPDLARDLALKIHPVR